MSAAEILPAAPAKPALVVVPKEESVLLRHDQLQPSPLNPRKHKRTDAQVAEMAESIAARGLLQNLVVRPLKGAKGKYEIGAGEGRWLGVGKLIKDGRATGAFQMRAVVRELSDEDMIEIGLAENGRRNDLHPLDEANGFLELWKRRTKEKGKKGAGEVVAELAKKVGLTPRYVQLQIKLASNLAPKAKELLEGGTINLLTARTLAARPQDEQKTFLARTDKDRLADMTARDVGDYFRRQWRPMEDAIFAPGAYKGPTEELDGEIYATDIKTFDHLQRAATFDVRRECTKLAKEGKIAFFEEANYFALHKYEVRKVDGKPDPKGGVFLKFNQYQPQDVEVYRGLYKTKETLRDEANWAKWRAEEAAARQKAKTPQRRDPRFKLLADHLKTDPHTVMAASLFNALSKRDGTMYWMPGRSYINDTHRKRVDAVIAKVGKVPAGGAELLAWLLKQPIAKLLTIWCAIEIDERRHDARGPSRASKVEELLFKHCGVKAPAKPSPKKKGKAK